MITFGLDASSPDVQFLRAPAASPAGGQDVASPWAAAAAASVMKRHHPVDSQLRGTNSSITSSGDAMAQIKHGKQTLSGNSPYFCFILTENSCPIEPHFPSAKQTRCNVGVTNVKSSFQTASLLHPTATAPWLSRFSDKVHNSVFFNWSISLTPVKSSLPRNKSKLAWRWCKSHKHLFWTCFNTSFSN